MRFPFALIVFSIFAASVSARQFAIGDYSAPRTTREAREAFQKSERQEKIFDRFAKGLSADTEDEWAGAFWTAGLLNETGPEVRAAIEAALAQFPQRSSSFQNATLRSVYTLYPNDYGEEVRATLSHITEPRPFATAVYYLLANDDSPDRRLELTQRLVEAFPDWKGDGRLAYLWKDLGAVVPPERPPIRDLLEHDFDGKPVIFSFQRHDRRYPGMAAVRGADGNWVRNDKGEFELIPQLAMSRTNMPGTITFGNSPQGLYTITSTGTSENVFIGPTPYLYSKVPFEASPSEYFHDSAMQDVEWSKGLYLALLPKSWRGYYPFQEAWYAGMAGRSEMLNHGTTIDSEYYRGEIYYPHTPSAGCLCTLEEWDPETGQLLESGQIRLLNAFHGSGDGTGHFVLVELDGARKPVSEKEVTGFLQTDN